MRRLQLGLLLGLLALSRPASAAEVTRVVSVEPDEPFALSLRVSWERSQERANLTREEVRDGRVVDATALRYVRTRNDLVTRLAVALYTDVELHAALPWVLGDEVTWRYGVDESGFTVGTPGNESSIATDGVDAMGQACAGPCPLFPVPSQVTRGGQVGDVSAGLAWAVFNGSRDDTQPTWVLGADATVPTARRYDPASGRAADWASPWSAGGRRGPTGEKVWRWDFYTALSRRIGLVEPYFRAHVTGLTASGQTYSNCDHVAALAAAATPQATLAAVQNCDAPGWKGETGAKLPWLAGLLFGAEFVPFEDTHEAQAITVDLRAFADYTSEQRFYNELTDLSGRLHRTGAYLSMGARAGVNFKASRYVSLSAAASFSTRTGHWLSGEPIGKSRGELPAGDLTGRFTDASGATVCDPAAGTCNPGLNPNFDARYDAPGKRFRVEDVIDLGLQVQATLNF